MAFAYVLICLLCLMMLAQSLSRNQNGSGCLAIVPITSDERLSNVAFPPVQRCLPTDPPFQALIPRWFYKHQTKPNQTNQNKTKQNQTTPNQTEPNLMFDLRVGKSAFVIMQRDPKRQRLNSIGKKFRVWPTLLCTWSEVFKAIINNGLKASTIDVLWNGSRNI